MPSYHTLPDLSGYKSKAAKKIARLVEEHERKAKELGALGSETEQARYALEDARNKDTEARARAARKGDKDPGKVNEEKARAHLEDLQDRHRVLERVVADIESDLGRTISESKVELLEEARTKRDKAGERYTAAHRELRESHDEQRYHAGIARWALSGSAHFSQASPNSAVLSVPDTLPADDPENQRPEVISTDSARGILRGA